MGLDEVRMGGALNDRFTLQNRSFERHQHPVTRSSLDDRNRPEHVIPNADVYVSNTAITVIDAHNKK
jgi:hypothetical protein